MAEENKPEDKEDFVIPEKFLKQLQEFSNGGFILMTFSSEGNPIIHFQVDTVKDRLALESTLFSYADKLDNDRYERNHPDSDKED